MKYPKAVINTSAIKHNVNLLLRNNKQKKLLIDLSNNAYGHGLIEIARALENQVDAFAVSRIDEGESLRDSGIKTKIIVLEGFTSSVELFKINDLALTTVIQNTTQLDLVRHYNEHLNNLEIWIKEQNSYSYGFSSNECIKHYTTLSKLSSVKHLAIAYPYKDANNQSTHLNGFKLRAKGGSDFWLMTTSQVYGICKHLELKQSNLLPVMSFETVLVQIHKRKKGDKIGYGSIYTVPEDTYIGVIALGYGDGFPRYAQHKTPFLLNGRLVPLVGRVSMDMINVDLGPQALDQAGDKVIIFGRQLPIATMCDFLDLEPQVLPATLTERVKLEYN